MLNELLYMPVEYRADDSRLTPGRLSGVLMPYETRASDRPEIFEQGALHWEDDGILVRTMHRRDRPVLRATPYLDGNKLRIDAQIPDSIEGRDAATGLKSGVYSGLSVEFRSQKETRRGNLRIIQKAVLTGAGLIDYPSYNEAVAELRARGMHRGRRRALWL